jgi:hypothetical protein
MERAAATIAVAAAGVLKPIVNELSHSPHRALAETSCLMYYFRSDTPDPPRSGSSGRFLHSLYGCGSS